MTMSKKEVFMKKKTKQVKISPSEMEMLSILLPPVSCSSFGNETIGKNVDGVERIAKGS